MHLKHLVMTVLVLCGAHASLASEKPDLPDLSPDDVEEIKTVTKNSTLVEESYTLPTNAALENSPTEITFSLMHPEELPESLVAFGDSTAIGFTDEAGIFALNMVLSPLDEEKRRLYSNFDEFKKALTSRFSDSENQLYGEYEILDEKNGEDMKSLTLSAFLRKQSDGILPELQIVFMEKTVLDRGVRATLSCEIRGSQAARDISSSYFRDLRPLCEKILNGYRYSYPGQ